MNRFDDNPEFFQDCVAKVRQQLRKRDLYHIMMDMGYAHHLNAEEMREIEYAVKFNK